MFYVVCDDATKNKKRHAKMWCQTGWKDFLHKCWFTLQCRAIEANECHQNTYNCSRAHVDMRAFCIFKIGNTFLFMYSKHKTFGMYNVRAIYESDVSLCMYHL